MESDGTTADYYELPKGATELQQLIAYKDMNAQMGEIFRANYRYGQSSHSNQLRDINKIIFYANAEKDRLLSNMQIPAEEPVSHTNPANPANHTISLSTGLAGDWGMQELKDGLEEVVPTRHPDADRRYVEAEVDRQIERQRQRYILQRGEMIGQVHKANMAHKAERARLRAAGLLPT